MNNFLARVPISQTNQLLINFLDRSVAIIKGNSNDDLYSNDLNLPSYSYKDFEGWLSNIRGDRSTLKAVIYLTTRCNLACSYCFQDGYSKNLSPDLTMETAKRILAWIKSYACENLTKEISLYLYGGEPCLKPELINFFAGQARDMLSDDGFIVNISMFTNGTILNHSVANAIKENYISNLQITLDGTEAIHNYRRPFTNGKGSFRSITSNLREIATTSNANITLLSNFDHQNIDSLPQLLDWLDLEGLSDRLTFTYNPVFRTVHNCHHCDCHSLPDSDSFAAWSNLLLNVYNRGLKCEPLPIFNKGPCSFWRKGHFVFDTTGNIFKCIGMPGLTDKSLGNVYSTSANSLPVDESVSLAGKVWQNQICLSCPYLPLCLGGCRFHAIVELNDITVPFCHKELIEQCELRTLLILMSKENDI